MKVSHTAVYDKNDLKSIEETLVILEKHKQDLLSKIKANTITLEDIKAFAIFRYRDEEVMICPAEYKFDSEPKFILSGLYKDFGLVFNITPKNQVEMFDYLTNSESGGCTETVYVKTGKRFTLVEE